MRDQFFNNPVVRAFWPATLPFITYDLCWKTGGPNANLIPSFEEITRIIELEYSLSMPVWWTAMFQ